MGNSMNIPEIETLSYHSSLCKCPNCGTPQEARENFTPIIEPSKSLKRGFMGLGCNKTTSAPQEGKEKTTPIFESETKVENKESVSQPQQPDYSKCRHCGACRVGRPTGEWQFACKCNEDDKIYPPEQPKDNPGPLEKLIMDRIEHDLENIAANLEMLNPETKEQKRAKCVLALEIARITGEGGIFDDLKEAFE